MQAATFYARKTHFAEMHAEAILAWELTGVAESIPATA
jgi:hypothetical protein